MRIYRRSQTIFVDSTSEVLKKLVFVVWFLWMWIIALISGNRLKVAPEVWESLRPPNLEKRTMLSPSS